MRSFTLSVHGVLVLAAALSTVAVAQPSLRGIPDGRSPLGSIAQRGPQALEILGISVEGVDSESMRQFVLQSSGLAVGQSITLPGDEAIADAIRNIYRLRVFSDVKILEERRAGTGVFLVIRVKEEPQLADFTITGIKKKDVKELQKKIPIFKGSRVRPTDLERSKQVIRDYFAEKGYMMASVDVRPTEEEDNRVSLEFDIDRGRRVRIRTVEISGNESIASSKVRGRMKKTKQRTWWKFWRKSRSVSYTHLTLPTKRIV